MAKKNQKKQVAAPEVKEPIIVPVVTEGVLEVEGTPDVISLAAKFKLFLNEAKTLKKLIDKGPILVAKMAAKAAAKGLLITEEKLHALEMEVLELRTKAEPIQKKLDELRPRKAARPANRKPVILSAERQATMRKVALIRALTKKGFAVAEGEAKYGDYKVPLGEKGFGVINDKTGITLASDHPYGAGAANLIYTLLNL